MNDLFRHKIIVDPVYGDIGLSELETKIIDTPTFQRLRKLKQLGLASLVYPNATHTRFGHSLGVLYVISRFIEVYKRKAKPRDIDIQKLRLAALLHDIGHYPYSHLMEHIEWEEYYETFMEESGKNDKEKDGQSDPFPKHDKLSELIVTARDDITKPLREAKIDPYEIAKIIRGEHIDIFNLLHKSLDVDRMDYLVRDSLNTGVPYGRIDVNYILNNLDILESREGQGSENEISKKIVVINEKARNAAEDLLTSRYYMFNTVYFHKTIFGFEEVVRKIVTLLMRQEEGFYKTGKQIKELIKNNDSELLNFNDGYIDKFIDKYADINDSSLLCKLCKTVKFRKPPKLVHEEIDLSSGNPEEEQQSRKYTTFKYVLKNQLDDVANEHNINPDLLIWKEPKGVRFEKLKPFVAVSKISDAREPELKQLVRVKQKNGEIKMLAEDSKSIISHLAKLDLKFVRLYGIDISDEQAAELRKSIKDKLQEA